MKEVTLNEVREAVAKLRKISQDEEVLMEVKNVELFNRLREAGKIKEIRPGVWSLAESISIDEWREASGK